MYIPSEFVENDDALIRALIADYGFALLVTTDQAGLPFASHLPMLFDPSAAGEGRLTGHMARANPQWEHFDPSREVLTVFSGPHAYVSPSWYATHPSVPTWNYAAVQAYGRPHIIDDGDAVRAHLNRMVETFEADFETPWRMDLPERYTRSRLRAIVAFEIEITRIEAKAKLSQNRDDTDRRSVAERLAGQGGDNARAVAAMMREREPNAR